MGYKLARWAVALIETSIAVIICAGQFTLFYLVFESKWPDLFPIDPAPFVAFFLAALLATLYYLHCQEYAYRDLLKNANTLYGEISALSPKAEGKRALFVMLRDTLASKTTVIRLPTATQASAPALVPTALALEQSTNLLEHRYVARLAQATLYIFGILAPWIFWVYWWLGLIPYALLFGSLAVLRQNGYSYCRKYRYDRAEWRQFSETLDSAIAAAAPAF